MVLELYVLSNYLSFSLINQGEKDRGNVRWVTSIRLYNNKLKKWSFGQFSLFVFRHMRKLFKSFL